eukprot:g6869.t1
MTSRPKIGRILLYCKALAAVSARRDSGRSLREDQARVSLSAELAEFAENNNFLERETRRVVPDVDGRRDEIRTLQYNLQLFPDFFRPANPLGTKRVDWLFEVLFPNLQREIEADHADATKKKQAEDDSHFLDFRLYQEVWGFRWDMESAAYLRNRHVDAGDHDNGMRCSPVHAGQLGNPTSMNSGLLTCFDSRRFRLLKAEESGVDKVSSDDLLSGPDYFQSFAADDRRSAETTWQMYHPPFDWLFWVLCAVVGHAVAYAYAPRTSKEGGYTPEENRVAIAVFAAGFVGMALGVTVLFNALAYTVGASMFSQLDLCLFGLPKGVLEFVRNGGCGRLIFAVVLPGVIGAFVVLWLTTRQSTAAAPAQPPELLEARALRRPEGASDDDQVGEERALLEKERSDQTGGTSGSPTNKCVQGCCLLGAFYLALLGFALAVAGFSGRYDWWGVADATEGAGRVSKDDSWFFRRFSQAVIDDAISAKGVLAAVFEKAGSSNAAASTGTAAAAPAPAQELFVVFNTHPQAIPDDDAILKRQLGDESGHGSTSLLERAEETRFRVLVNQYHELALFMHEVVEAVRRKTGGNGVVHVLLAGDTNFHRVNLHYATGPGKVFDDPHPFLFEDGGDALRLLTGMASDLYEKNTLTQQIFGEQHPSFQTTCVENLGEALDGTKSKTASGGKYSEKAFPFTTLEDVKKHGYDVENACRGTGVAKIGWKKGFPSGSSDAAFGYEVGHALQMADLDQVALFPWPQFQLEGDVDEANSGGAASGDSSSGEAQKIYRTKRAYVPWKSLVVQSAEQVTADMTLRDHFAVISDHFPLLSTARPSGTDEEPLPPAALPETSAERGDRLRERVRMTRVGEEDLDGTLGFIVAHAPLVLALLGSCLFALALWWASCLVDQKHGSDISAGELVRRSESEHDVEESKPVLDPGSQGEAESKDAPPKPAVEPPKPVVEPPEPADDDDADKAHVEVDVAATS